MDFFRTVRSLRFHPEQHVIYIYPQRKLKKGDKRTSGGFKFCRMYSELPRTKVEFRGYALFARNHAQWSKLSIVRSQYFIYIPEASFGTTDVESSIFASCNKACLRPPRCRHIRVRCVLLQQLFNYHVRICLWPSI